VWAYEKWPAPVSVYVMEEQKGLMAGLYVSPQSINRRLSGVGWKKCFTACVPANLSRIEAH